MKHEVVSGFATQDLIELVVLIICGADICLEDACIPFSGLFSPRLVTRDEQKVAFLPRLVTLDEPKVTLLD